MVRPVQWPEFTTALIGRLGPLGMVGRAQAGLDSAAGLASVDFFS
jgi:hypothetical protein